MDGTRSGTLYEDERQRWMACVMKFGKSLSELVEGINEMLAEDELPAEVQDALRGIVDAAHASSEEAKAEFLLLAPAPLKQSLGMLASVTATLENVLLDETVRKQFADQDIKGRDRLVRAAHDMYAQFRWLT